MRVSNLVIGVSGRLLLFYKLYFFPLDLVFHLSELLRLRLLFFKVVHIMTCLPPSLFWKNLKRDLQSFLFPAFQLNEILFMNHSA
ncbi:hypothetical protein PEDI_38050 [Persicobacter diffluens]|uniref:Uncharacterized protein n=1 Tax=Persicobacter diffluens TaxID=981 RepID=A0AAN5ANX1_9BACT|nr:hypothetical protein PEDI_38050 [Persicobacter diffluens]